MATALTNRTPVLSRYSGTPVRIDDAVRPGIRRQEVYVRPDISLTDAVQHVVQASDIGRLDNVAYEAYRNPNLWWVIAMVNGIHNQFRDMVIGAVILIPDITEVNSALDRNRV